MSTKRLVNLHAGLVLFGVSIALMVRADLGLASWDVLHQGLARKTGLPLGWVINGVAVVVLLLWIPLRQRPGYGTLANVVVVGLVAQAALDLLPSADHLGVRSILLATGIVMNAIATGLYVGAGLGPGPRDGLMTGFAARGHSIRLVRTSIELTVLALGWLLGGTVGVGTVLYAITIGPLVHYFLPKLTVDTGAPRATPQRHRRQHPTRTGGCAGRGLVRARCA
ncbi:MAG: hypothetical protein L0Y54_06940 [Sporichthyaceae bacterium]|nr:hypothetical protein [Sporichthyaceae bacterium]